MKAMKHDNLSIKLFENLQSEILIPKPFSHWHITRLIDIMICSLVIIIRPSFVSIYDRSELKSTEYCPGRDLTTILRGENM